MRYITWKSFCSFPPPPLLALLPSPQNGLGYIMRSRQLISREASHWPVWFMAGGWHDENTDWHWQVVATHNGIMEGQGVEGWEREALFPLFALTGFVSLCVGSKVYLLCSSVFTSQLKRNTTAPKVCCHSDGKADPHLKKSLPPSITDTGQKQQSVQSTRPARARHHCVNVTHI